MWNRISGKSSAAKDDPPSHTTRRNDGEERSKQSRSEAPVSPSSNKKPLARADEQSSRSSRETSLRGDDRYRGFNPTSTSYSATIQSPYPGTANVSVAAASGNHNDEPYVPPGLMRNASLAGKTPGSRSSRDERAMNERRDPRGEQGSNRDDNEEERDRDDQKREKRKKLEKRDKDRVSGSSRSTKSSRNESGYGNSNDIETSRGPADFPDQVGASGFSQFPGQYNGGMPHTNGDSSEHPMSSNVQDQFPGQFPDQSAAPYRPPIAASEGGLGLAAEYYGDAGESVAEQPGNRANTPSLIVGAEPHLQAALAVAAPPPEPSASGGVGAAASFFSGEFDEHESATSHGQQTSSTFATAPNRPQGSHHSSYAQAIPTVGGTAMGAAAGYFIGSQASSHTQGPDHISSSVGGAQQEHGSISYQRPPSPTAESYYSNASRPPRQGKQFSQSSNAALYAAGAAGAAGLAAAAYQHDHQTFSQDNSSRPQNPMAPMAQRHRHHGPLGAVVDFFRDPEGVAEFEEYSEIIGVCKYCFAPGSSPRDAPRKHHYRKKRSNDSLGRVDKESRYHSSEYECRRKKDKSWLATGLAGYGLAKVGESLFKQKNDFNNTSSVKTSRHSPDGGYQKSRRRSRSKDRIETGIFSDDKVYKKEPQAGFLGGSTERTYETRRRSRSRSRPRDRKSGRLDATFGATIGSSTAAPSSRRQRRASPKDAFGRTKHRNGEHSPERRHKLRKKKKRGFLGISSASSSSSSVDTAHRSEKHRSKKGSSTKSKDDKKAEAAILGLGAAAAALSLNDGRNGYKKKEVKELVGVKETRGSRSRDSRHDYRSEDEVWESAPEDEYESADSALAYGGPRRKGSRESLSSDSSGTHKWGWRWGGKKERRDPPANRKTSDPSNLPTIPGAAGAGLAGAAMMSPDEYQGNGLDSKSSLPLQQVYPIPTSDPTRFDVGREASVASSSRPAVVPIQHPQPIVPVSAALYSSQQPYEHSYSAPTGPHVFSAKQYPAQSTTGINARFARPEFAIPGSFAQTIPHAKEPESSLKLRKRCSSPARFGDDADSSSMVSHRHASTKDDTSTVRFDRTEEQEEKDRRERRRKRRQDREHREAEEQEQLDKEHEAGRDKFNRKFETSATQEESPKRSSEMSWSAPAVAGVVGAAVGAVTLAEKSKSKETREERPEPRRRDGEREEGDDQEPTRKRERRRKDRERERGHDIDELVDKEPQIVLDGTSQNREAADRSGQATEKGRSIWQEAASPKKRPCHEDYGTFFRPLDLNDSIDQVKATSANTNAVADFDFDQTPAIVTVVPKGFRDPDTQPTFSPADTDDVVDISKLSFPVPRLRLLEPTPPSSRDSTPIIQPRDTSDQGIEEAPRDPSLSQVTWGDDQTHEDTVVSAEADDERGQFIGSAPGEIGDTGLEEEPELLKKSALPSHTGQPNESSNTTESNNASNSFSDDIEFAATLAASAEDAGFDPSIVIDDPMYRRRDSPPGSNDLSMPGGFDDDEQLSLNRKDQEKEDREAKLRAGSREPNGRDDDVFVQDIISQVENSEPRIPKKSSVDNLHDDLGSRKKFKSKNSKKARNEDSGSKDEFLEFSESVVRPQRPESREMYESPQEDTPSVTSSAPLTNEGGSSRKFRRKSKRDSTGLNDTASTVSGQSTVNARSGSESKPKKSSVWGRVLGILPLENATQDLPDEANMDAFEEPKKKSMRSKRWKSTIDENDNDEIASKWSATGDQDEGSMGQDPGRITQDLPAKVHTQASINSTLRDDTLIRFKDLESSPNTVTEASPQSQNPKEDNEPEQICEQRSESFLDMRPEPPPPPDIILKEEEPPDPFATAGTSVSPRSLPEERTRQYPQVSPSDPLPSPTAVPFDFRFSRPRPSIRSARSMSQTPPSSPHVTADLPPRTRPRPRSTEFKSSSEFRPLMLVERHRSHQESVSEEAYPSLPSSRTTSRASSVRDPKEDQHDQRDVCEMSEFSHDPCETRQGIIIDTNDTAVQSDLLDSQQATPTTSSFQHPTTGHDGSPVPGSRGSSQFGALSIARDAAIGAVVKGAAAFALHKLSQDDDQPMPVLPQEEQGQLQQGLDSVVIEQGINRSEGDKIVPAVSLTAREQINPVHQEHPREREAQLQDSLVDVAPHAENTRTHDSGIIPRAELGLQEDLDHESDKSMLPANEIAPFSQYVSPDVEAPLVPEADALSERDFAPREDFAPQLSKKGKKGKRKPSKRDMTAGKPLLPATGSTKNSIDIVSDPSNPENTRQIQEQDTQDAVDSWFAPTSLKKDKKTKQKGTFKRLQETSEPTASIDNPRENLDSSESKNSQSDEKLIRDMSSGQVADLMVSVAQDVENVGEDIPRSTTAPNGDAMVSLLERSQSESEVKKGKKGQGSTLQGDASSPTSPAGKVVVFNKPFSEHLDNNAPHSSNPAVASEGLGTVDEHQEPSGVELSPEEIPLPFDEDLDLLDQNPEEIPLPFDEDLDLLDQNPEEIPLPLDEDLDLLDQNPEEIPLPLDENLGPLDQNPQEPSVPPAGQSDESEVNAHAENHSEALPSFEKFDLSAAEVPRELSNKEDKQVANDSLALPSRRTGKKGKKAEPGILEAVVLNIDVKNEAVPPEELSDAAAQKQTQYSAEEPSGETSEEPIVVADELARLEIKRKVEKGRKAKQSFEGDPPMQSEVSSNPAVQDTTQELAEKPVVEMSNQSTAVEDEWAGFGTKKKGKKSKQSKQNFRDDAGASADVRREEPMLSSRLQDVEEDPTRKLANKIEPLEESITVNDKWEGIGSSKEAKKSKKGKQGISKDAETGTKVETGIPSFAATPKVAGDWQPQDLAETIETNAYQQEPNVVEDELAGFSSTGKGKNAKKIKQHSAVDDEKNADPVTDTRLADANPEVVEDVKDRNPIEQGDVNIFHEEPQAVENECAGFSTKKGKKNAKKNIVVDAQEATEMGLNSPVAVTASEMVEDVRVEDSPSQDIGNISSNEPQTVGDEGADSGSKKNGKKDKKRKSKTLDLGPAPLAEFAGPQGTDNSDSDPLAAPQVTTSTSPDVAAILGAEGKLASNDKELEESILTSRQADRELHESITDSVLDYEERDRTREAIVSSKASDLETLELEIIDQYADDQDLPGEEVVDPEAKEPETQEVEIIVQDSREDTMPPTLDLSRATTDTAKAFQHILGDKSIPDTPSHEGAAAASPSAKHEPSAAEHILQNAEPDWALPKNKREERSKQEEAKVKDFVHSSTAPADVEEHFSQETAVQEPDWNVPKKKKGKKGRKEALMLDELEADDNSQTSISPADAAVPLDQEPGSEVVAESASKKSKKDKKNKKKSVSRTPNDFEAATESVLNTTEVPQDLRIKDTNPILQEEAPPANTSLGTDLQGQKNSESSATIKPIQAFKTEGMLREGESENLQDLKSPMSEKNKTQAKKVQILNWEDEGDAASVPEDKPLAEPKSFKNGVQDHTISFERKVIDELTEDPEDRANSNKGHKMAANAQPWSLESENSIVSLDLATSHETYQRISINQTENLRGEGPSHTEDAGLVDDVEPPVQGYPNPEIKEQSKEPAHEAASVVVPVSEQGPTASDDPQVPSERFGANVNQPFVDAEYPSYSLKRAKKDKKHVEKARSLTLNDNELQQELQAAFEEPNAKKMQDEPSIIPIPEHSDDWSRQDRSIEQIEPTEVVEPGETPLEIQEHKDAERGITPPATKRPVDPPIEAAEHDFAPIQKNESDEEYTEERHLTFEPETALSAMEGVVRPIVTAGSKRSEEMTSEEHPQYETDASGERHSTLEASILPPTADARAGEPLNAPKTQGILGTQAEDERWGVSTKRGKKGKKSKKKPLDFVFQADRSLAEGTQSTLTTVDPTQGGKPRLEEQASGNSNTFEGVDNTSSITGGDTTEPSAVPDLQKDLEMKVEDDPWGMPTKKGKKGKQGKKPKKERLSNFEAETVQTITEATPVSIVTAMSGPDNEPILEEQPKGKPDASEKVGDVDPITEEEPKEPPLALQTQGVTRTRAGDELWDISSKKGKKGKKRRNDVSRIQEDVEMTDATSSGLPEAAQGSMDRNQHRPSVADAEAPDIVVPEDEFLDPQEQSLYDQEYVWELERQGVDNPRSSKVELPVSAAASEALSSQQQLDYSHDRADKPERGGYEASQGPTKDLPTPTQESEMQVTQGPLEHQQERAKDFEQQVLKPPPSPTLDLPNQAAVPEQPAHGPEYRRDFDCEESESFQTPTKELPTPAAEVVMLDAQEQQEYDDEYAKELERQLSPLQKGERSDVPAAEAYATSTFQPSIDPTIGIPPQERTPLARPPPLEDIVEESRSRSGSVQETTPNREEDNSPLKATKKSKKGKKGKKQQQPIIWEDDPATPPVEGEPNQAVDVQIGSSAVPEFWEPGASDQPIDLEEPIEHRPVDDSSRTSPTHIELANAAGEAEDYFATQPSKPAKEDIGRDPENDGFRRSLSTDFPYSMDERLPEQEMHPSIEDVEHTQQGLYSDERMNPDSISEFYQPDISTAPINEEANETFSHAPTKKSKKDQTSKIREVGRNPSPSMEDLEQHSAIPTVEPSGQTSAPEDHLPQRSSHRVEAPSLGRYELTTGGYNIRDTEGLAATAGSRGAAALAAEGLAERDSTKGSKKVKKGKKATRWADLEDETPQSGSPVSKEENVTETAGQVPVLEKPSGVLQTPEQQSAIRPRQEFHGPSPQSPAALAGPEPILEAIDNHYPHSQKDHSIYRDSAINVSESPVISEEVPVHRAVRDSGYPETESSPVLASEPQYHDPTSEAVIDDLYDMTSQQSTQGHDQSYRTPKCRRSTPQSTEAMDKGLDYDVFGSKPKERQRRSRSYDSDDSAGSGFDIQRRRRRQAMAREAREPSPVNSTTKDRSSALFNSPPSAREKSSDPPHEEPASTRDDSIRQEPTWSFCHQDSPPSGTQGVPREINSPHKHETIPDQRTYDKLIGRHSESSASLFGGPFRQDEDIMSESRSPPSSEVHGGRRRLNTISEDSQERLSLHAKDKRALSDVGSPEAGAKERRVRSPPATDDASSYVSTGAPMSRRSGPSVDEEQPLDDHETSRGRNTEQIPSRHSNLSSLPNIPPTQRGSEHRTASAAGLQSDNNSIHAIIRTPDQVRSASGQSYRSSGTPPLRRVDRSISGDLRGASKSGEAKLGAKTPEAELDSGVNIPSSSTYDPVTDKGKSRAEMADVYEGWGDVRGQSPMSPMRPPSMRKRQSMQLLDLETRLDQLISENRLLQSQKSTAERTLQEQTRNHTQQRHAYEEALEEHKMFLAQKDSELDELRDIVEDWQNKVTHLTVVNEGLTASRGVDDEQDQRYRELEAEHLHLRERHTELTTGMEALVQREVASHLEAKNTELQRLRDELESAKQQVQSLQQQLLASKESEDFVEKDEDYFDSQCQSLCQHVQQWVLRFSKFSDMKACYRASEIRDETKLDHMENAILDGTDVDIYLQDRVKRRDVFMAVVMTMIFDYIFTRYLFGMDREQRQKLKNLERTLQEIGPMSAVCKWRATTLTLLMKREDFARQRTTDTEAIVHEIYDTLATFLPPPSHLVPQIQDSLRKVINSAADLSIEMRTQRADYQMLPPLQPDYDTNGDLAQKVYFNALTMNERSGATTSNQALQEQGAVVRMVLFPLVVKNEEDDEQIIVCPAQVLTADSKAKKTVRVMSVQGSTQGGRSEASFAGSEGGMF